MAETAETSKFGNVVYAGMRYVIAIALPLLSAACAEVAPRYLPTIQQRWDASDLVCTAITGSPARTGLTRRIDGSDRDQLSAALKIESCFKGKKPQPATVTVLGYSLVAAKDIQGKGFAYSGPPTGFLNQGRNLVFLKRTAIPNEFEMAVPIYETAIRLADSRPYYPNDHSPTGVRFALTREFEAALLQFRLRDISEIEHIFDLLGNKEAIIELRRFSTRAPLDVQRDIAVSLLNQGEVDSEPAVISLLQDASASAWKRQNAAGALGVHGTRRALPVLRQVAAEPATSDGLRSLRVWTLEAIQRLQRRLGESQGH